MAERREVDLTGLKCPLPIVQLNKLVKQLSGGDELVAIADDPAFSLDVQAWCRMTGHELVTLENKEGRLSAVIRKKA